MPHQLLVPPCETHDRRRASVSSSFSLASSFPSLITADSLNSSLSSPSTDLPNSLLTLLPTGHPTPRQLDQASRLPPTPRSRRWERGVGGSLAHDVVLNGGGGAASSSLQNQELRWSKVIRLLVSRVVRKLVQVVMTFLMRRRTTLLMTLRTTFVTTSVACDAGACRRFTAQGRSPPAVAPCTRCTRKCGHVDGQSSPSACQAARGHSPPSLRLAC